MTGAGWRAGRRVGWLVPERSEMATGIFLEERQDVELVCRRKIGRKREESASQQGEKRQETKTQRVNEDVKTI